MILPLAHIGHWLWVLYVLPVLIVIGGIFRTTKSEKRAAREEDAIEASTGVDTSASGTSNETDGPDASAESPGQEDPASAGGTGQGPRTDKPARPRGPAP